MDIGISYILTELKKWVRQTAAQANGLLLPVSGGSDSALVFHILNSVYPEKTVGVFVGSNLRARDWFESEGTIRYLPELASPNHAEVERNAIFQKLALDENRWLVGTRNRTENVFGTFSLASRIATYLPIAGLWKSDVMQLCSLIGVPEEVLASSRRADPDCGRPKELAEIPLELIDVFLKVRIGVLAAESLTSCGLEPAQIAYLDKAYKGNKWRTGLPTEGPQLD